MVRVLPLAMVDDVLGISQCGNKSIAQNTFINTHMEMKRLRFHTPSKSKCHKLHVGKKNTLCPESKGIQRQCELIPTKGLSGNSKFWQTLFQDCFTIERKLAVKWYSNQLFQLVWANRNRSVRSGELGSSFLQKHFLSASYCAIG